MATEILVLLSDLMLRMGPAMIVLHMVMVAILCLGLSGISVGLGARLPNLKEDDPSKIAAGFGGTLNLLVSLVFICSIVMVASRPLPPLLRRPGQPRLRRRVPLRIAVPILDDRRDRRQPGRRGPRDDPAAPHRDQGVSKDGTLKLRLSSRMYRPSLTDLARDIMGLARIVGTEMHTMPSGEKI